MPKVSVCIPSYNNAKFLNELIQSILTQTFSDFELIICDDASKDSSLEIIQSFKDPRIRFYANTKNLGIVGNMNRCISLAQGKYIYIIGSDDVMLPDNLLKKVEFLEKHPSVGFVCSNILKIDAEGKLLGHIWGHPPENDTVIDKKDCFRQLIQQGNFICHPSVLLLKECHEKLGLYDKQFPSCQDYEFWTRMSLHYDLGYIAEPLVKYRWHADNTTNQYLAGNMSKAFEQDNLTKKVAMENYHKQSTHVYFTDDELSHIYFEMGRFYFWADKFNLSRKLLIKSIHYKKDRLKSFYFLLLASLPLKVIHFLRKTKRTPQTT